ncbi:unnamed protein product [Clavelina lepadiformis]|uniref:Major facilitator superfamily (MFS) profile domain-containing protein n=1 Tax=Clavelina lepadiformis TaxID=159417 RepID=A0ABP0GA36_CLALP
MGSKSSSLNNTELKPLVDDSLSLSTDSVPKQTRCHAGGSLCLFACCGVVLIGAIAVGTMLGLSSPMIPDIQRDTSKNAIHLSVTQASWFGALVTLGGIVGGILAGFIIQAIGRRLTSILSAIPYIVGLLLICFASRVWMLYLGRVISGLGVGISSLIVPVYIGEIATAEVRGMLGSGTQLCIVIGILIIYGIGNCLPWRILAAAAIAPPVLLAILSFFIPETPRFLMMKKKPDEAKKALRRLRGVSADIDEEYQELEDSLSQEVKPASWLEIIKDPGLRTPTLLSLGAMYFQQLSGINCVMFYAKTLFQEAGFNNPTQLSMALLLIAGVQVLFTFISCLIIDKTGRKILIIIGAVFMTLSLIMFGVYFQLQSAHSSYMNEVALNNQTAMTNGSTAANPASHHVPALTWLALVSMMIFIAAYSIGIGPIAWLLVGEIIPVRARGNSAGLATAFNLFLVFILTLEFSDMLASMTPQGTFWFFAANCALSILFTVIFLPETKGKSLEEIEALFRPTSE